MLRTSQKFPGLTWVDYDVRFSQAAAGDEERQWALLDTGLYTECVTTQAGQWVAEAHREETRERESSRKRARSWQESPLDTDWTTSETNRVVCRKFNWYRETVDLVASASLRKSAAGAKGLTRWWHSGKVGWSEASCDHGMWNGWGSQRPAAFIQGQWLVEHSLLWFLNLEKILLIEVSCARVQGGGGGGGGVAAWLCVARNISHVK